jgi:hypothetical protein
MAGEARDEEDGMSAFAEKQLVQPHPWNPQMVAITTGTAAFTPEACIDS